MTSACAARPLEADAPLRMGCRSGVPVLGTQYSPFPERATVSQFDPVPAIAYRRIRSLKPVEADVDATVTAGSAAALRSLTIATVDSRQEQFVGRCSRHRGCRSLRRARAALSCAMQLLILDSAHAW